MKVAITGGIACGKSTVSNYLIKKGYKVVDADKIGHNILTDELVKKELVDNFSQEILENNIINRKKLANIVFSDENKLTKLNEIMHPIIKNKIIASLNEEKRQLIFLDIALLFESNFTNLVDKIIVIYIDKETQINRLMSRNNFSKEEAEKRIASQMSSEEKIMLADYIIDNSRSKEETYVQIDKILKNLEEEVDGFRDKKLDGWIQ